jgi:hypothetical protein
MSKPFAYLAAAALGLAATAPLCAQTLPAGKWSGTMAPPSSEGVAVSFDVAGIDDSLVITMTGPDGRQIPFGAIRVESGKLEFQWSPGNTTVQCELTKQDDGTYRGPCTDTEGMTGQLAMVPPPKS